MGYHMTKMNWWTTRATYTSSLSISLSLTWPLSSCIKYIADENHYKEVLSLVGKAKQTVWIGTADIKDLYVDDKMGRKKSSLQSLTLYLRSTRIPSFLTIALIVNMLHFILAVNNQWILAYFWGFGVLIMSNSDETKGLVSIWPTSLYLGCPDGLEPSTFRTTSRVANVS